MSWRNRDLSLVPRACLCGYCSAKGAAYVSKSGTAVDALIRKGQFHVVREHGSRQAAFHECSYCGDVVIVTVQIEGILYCALNVLCLEDWRRFPQPVAVNFSDHTPEEKLRRWRQNWCYPVHMAGGKG